jgi:hypothetical protein
MCLPVETKRCSSDLSTASLEGWSSPQNGADRPQKCVLARLAGFLRRVGYEDFLIKPAQQAARFKRERLFDTPTFSFEPRLEVVKERVPSSDRMRLWRRRIHQA